MKSQFDNMTLTLSVCLTLLFIPQVLAETQTGIEPPPFAISQIYPEADSQYDWVQLTSSEVLKGTIKSLNDDELEFKSKDLGTTDIDWEDIKVLKSRSIVSVGFTDLTTKTGTLYIKDGRTYIGGEEFDRTQIMTIIEGGQTEANYWSSEVSLGANFYSGNTDQIDYTASAEAIRRTTQSRYSLKYDSAYTKSEDETTADNQKLNTKFNWYISKRMFFTPIDATITIDPIKNIAYQVNLGLGLGYDIIDNNDTTWSISAGPGYTYTQFENVAPGESDNEGSPSLKVLNEYDTEITSDIDFYAKYEINYLNELSGGYTHNAEAKFSIELTDMLDLDLRYIWDHINKPQADNNNIFPEQNDYRFIIQLSLDI
ncbi:YdiY family protein [Shewanella sp. VB17]|uniref:DUF481 domain-containing protein n=1 Tax=Shewanella sp. VB17 TaxID=2739432 RepID=UPI0020B7A346|nr:DUF481 domain-containing protein [Shewanella sp. VB17]